MASGCIIYHHGGLSCFISRSTEEARAIVGRKAPITRLESRWWRCLYCLREEEWMKESETCNVQEWIPLGAK